MNLGYIVSWYVSVIEVYSSITKYDEYAIFSSIFVFCIFLEMFITISENYEK